MRTSSVSLAVFTSVHGRIADGLTLQVSDFVDFAIQITYYGGVGTASAPRGDFELMAFHRQPLSHRQRPAPL